MGHCAGAALELDEDAEAFGGCAIGHCASPLEEADDVGMIELLHDGDLLAYLVLGAAELVGEREVWIAGKVVVSSKLLEPVALVLPPYCFHGLHASQRMTWVYSLTSERDNGER